MGPRLGLLLAAFALVATGCGSSSSSTATEPNQAESHPSSGPIDGAHVLPLVAIHAIAGRVSGVARPLGTPAQVASFVAQFPPTQRQRVQGALEPALRKAGPNVVGAVVASGCDVPPGAVVSADGQGGVQITAQEVASPLPECLVPVTTVALVELPGD
jgi:hypothetical protein